MSRGHQRERAVRDLLRDEGWVAFRAPASLGIADVVALKDGSRPRLIEVKSDSVEYGPFNNFGPKRRAELIAGALQAGADALLAYWPPRGQLQWIETKDWP